MIFVIIFGYSLALIVLIGPIAREEMRDRAERMDVCSECYYGAPDYGGRDVAGDPTYP